ncbi:MAG: 16S rRNA (adenine(1518)-N(6)/adenine(1519)-N(6))-dimethyltransferase RsmA [Rhodobacteraceae bacterium]|nr:16S rRNA (adenine(1518)-N(6)/adenine(1519)-N(6))-dimethyltransferase RsmA [Paracoccaceae bacterium]
MTDLSNLPPLREVIARHKLSANRRLGQNFLFDSNITRKIARSAAPLEGRDILEVGPGPGGLTRSLIEAGAGRILAVEKDARFLAPLQEIAAIAPNLDIRIGDAMTFEGQRYFSSPAAIISNLPFNLATALLVRWLESPIWPPFWDSMTLMFQRETAERIVAGPGSKAYGRLSILAQWRSRADLLFRVPASAFVPKPRVDAAVISIRPCPQPENMPSLEILSRVTGAAFGQRRKMLATSLSRLHPEILSLIHAADIDPRTRPEKVGVRNFCRLARLIAETDIH